MPQSTYEKNREDFKNFVIFAFAELERACSDKQDRIVSFELFMDDIGEIADSLIENM